MHYGLTSSDVVDTALALQIQDAGRLVLAGLDRALDAVVAPRRGAPPHDLHRPLARDPRRADHVRLEARRLGVRARPRPRRGSCGRSRRTASASSPAPSAPTAALEPEVERIACERLGLEPDPLSTQVIARDRHAELLSALAICATSLDRFATEIRHLARTEVREVEEPFAPGMKGSSAMPHKRNPKVAERISGLARVVRAAAVVGLENMALWHERDISHSSAERVDLPDAFLALDYMLDRFTWIVEGLVVYPERMLREPRRLARARLLAPAAARARRVRTRPRRGVPARAAQRDAGVGRGARLPRSSSRADPEIASRLDADALDEVFDLARDRRPRRHRLRAAAHASPARRNPSMSEAATHVASGKVRELYALDDERLLLVASDRISTFDVVLPTEIPDKGRVLTGLSGFWFAQTRLDRPEPPARAARRRPLDRVPPARDAADRVRRPRLPRRVRLEGLPRDRRGLRPPPPGRPRRVAAAAGADLHARDEGPDAVTTRTSTERRPSRSSARSASTRWSALTLELYRFVSGYARRARDHPRRHEARVRARRTAASCSPTRRSRPTRRASGPPTSTPPAAPQPSFDKQFVRDYCESLGWDKTPPGPELPDDVVEGTRARYVEAFERLTGIELRRLRSPARHRAAVLG